MFETTMYETPLCDTLKGIPEAGSTVWHKNNTKIK